jgi:hypothetical protein
MRVRALVALAAVATASLAFAGSAIAPSSAVADAAIAPSSTLADAANVTATQTYLQANYTLMRYFTSHIPAARAELAGVLAGVQRECPNAAAGSPEDADSEQLSNEVIGTMVTTVAQHNVAPIRAAIRAVAPLSWSNGALTRSVRAESAKGKVLSSLAVPDLCADVKSWVASDFQTLPASTVSFDRQFMPAWVAPGFLPAALSAYETPEERTLARRTAQLEQQWTEFEAREVETWGTIMDTLMLWP